MKSTVVFGFLGTSLDRAQGTDRWSKWRPTVAMCQQEDLLISRVELLVETKFKNLAQQVVADIQQVSPETVVKVNEINFSDPWDFQEVYEGLYDLITNYSFKTDKEDYFIHLTTGTHVAQICWFLLNEANFIPARLLQTSPVRTDDRHASAAGRYSIIDLDLSKYDRLATRFAQEQEKTLDFLKSGIATKSKTFNKLIEQIELVAVNSKAPMLIMGPTGAGKSMLASRIFDLRHSRAGITGRFVEVNCATLRGDQAMSTLFGHKRGAFTGAQTDRPGLLKEADKGLIFLDEIGELGLDEQAMLLQALEDKTFLPLGSDKSVSSDFQLIAGTNRDLRMEVQTGQFREDLLARINLWTFTLPSLAERREDISANLDFELERFAKTHRRQVRFNKESRDAFLKFARSPDARWSANFRDLNAAVTRMATLAPKGRITTTCVESEIARLKDGWSSGGIEKVTTSAALEGLDREQIDPFDWAQLEYVLQVCKDSKTLSDAGRKLFTVSRTSKAKANDADRLKKYLARFGLTWDQVK
ncbi:transcriptional regulatory protein RtcR [Prosthecobacter debontii]|uniref:Transcriptional regulatory protein RtcR n=1 Tax=Prosthecobacter debontii TaxID=48467 RepID=A0A1T4WWN2_9BACT|nr:RNA repair transcriptional activator RtcR [Prosthecobacter debontii]SKA81278.1 transcriptional regulatory protein RtcR [Prosthecobacter debontii]